MCALPFFWRDCKVVAAPHYAHTTPSSFSRICQHSVKKAAHSKNIGLPRKFETSNHFDFRN